MVEYAHLGLATSFIAGVISFLSPCVLPLVPGYISFVAGQAALESGVSPNKSRFQSLGLSACFVGGFSTVFMVLGASATVLGRLLLSYRYELNLIGGLVVIAFGLLATGLWQPKWMMGELRAHPNIPGGRPAGAYVLGLAFGFGWTPCIGPVLGTILTLTAVASTISHGVMYLGFYALGLGLPFLITAASAEAVASSLRKLRSMGRWLQVTAGATMMVMGGLMITGQLSTLSYWLLETIPALGRIG